MNRSINIYSMLNHKGTQIIITERLILRPFRMEDAPAMFANWANDDEVTKFLTWPSHGTLAVTKMVLSDWVSHYENERYYQWALEFEGEPIGSISVVGHDDRVGKAEIGYCIGKNWWHRGIMTEALRAVMDFLFREVGLRRIEACHDPRNPHSGAVMQKCGMEYEGTLRQSGWNNQGICDISWYASIK